MSDGADGNRQVQTPDIDNPMEAPRHFEYPPAELKDLKRACRLEWISLAYLVSSVILLYLVLGSSQAMRTSWLDSLLALASPIAFLVAIRFYDRKPSPRFPYGYHTAVTIGYLVGAVVLFVLGGFLIYESGQRLIMQVHPTIGSVELFGRQIWLGWLMIAALIYDAAPAIILGHLKLPLSRRLHDKVLYADARTNRAAWLTDAAAMLGIIGIGLGLWWADAVAALLISLDIAHDGLRNLRAAVGDLMDRVPQTVDQDRLDPLLEQVSETVAALPWVVDSQVRLREEGHVYFGEAFVVPADEDNLVERIAAARRDVMALDWRVHDFVISPVPELPAREKLVQAQARGD